MFFFLLPLSFFLPFFFYFISSTRCAGPRQRRWHASGDGDNADDNNDDDESNVFRDDNDDDADDENEYAAGGASEVSPGEGCVGWRRREIFGDDKERDPFRAIPIFFILVESAIRRTVTDIVYSQNSLSLRYFGLDSSWMKQQSL